MKSGVAIVIESLGGGGAQQVATALANAWVRDGNVTVITFQSSDSDFFKLNARVRRLVLGNFGLSRNIIAGFFANLMRIRRLRTAIIGSEAGTVLSFVGSTNVLTVLASLGLKHHVYISERNDPARQSLGPVWDVLRRLLYRHADRVIANSNSAIKTMKAYVSPERMVWLPNPLRAAQSESSSSPMVQPFFLAVGRLNRQKAYDVLLQAFVDVATELPEWQLVVLGAGPLQSDLLHQADTLGISDRVHFLGHVDDPFPWYRAAKILVHPARFEGLPNAVLEAMGEGVPVIVSDAQSGLTDFVRHNETGIVVPVESAPALAQAMTMLAGDPRSCGRIGDAARDAVSVCRADRAIQAWNVALAMDKGSSG